MPSSLPTPEELENCHPIPLPYQHLIAEQRSFGKSLLRRETPHFLLFVGPCSIHDPASALEYARRLKKLSTFVSQEIFLVMRVFLEKSRTHLGWKGYVYDPELDGSYQLEKGIKLSRLLLLELIKQEIPLATEFLDPLLLYYHDSFFSWGIIGARTAASPVHRQMASYLDFPVGFKNETDGTLDNAILGALCACHPQTLVGIDKRGKVSAIRSQGNHDTHLILRGSLDRPNHDPLSLSQAMYRQQFYGLDRPLVVDCGHGNCQKNPKSQIDVLLSVVKQRIEGNSLIIGAMLESHLEGGKALSITDPCLGWEETEQLILEVFSSLASSQVNKATLCKH